MASYTPRNRSLSSCTTNPLIVRVKLVFSEPYFSSVKNSDNRLVFVNIMHEVSLLWREFSGINPEAEDIEDLR